MGSVAVAVEVRLLLDPVLGEAFPFTTVFLAILVTAWFGGFGPALAAAVLGGIAADYFLLAPRGGFSLATQQERIGFMLYLATGIGIAIFGGAMEAARRTLEEHIRERTAELEGSRESIQESEARLASIVNSAMDAIISVDSAQNVVLFNAAAERMFQCPAAEAMGRQIDRFIPRRFREDHRRYVEGFGNAGVTSRSMHSLGELAGLRGDGTEFPIEASISQVEVARHKIYTVIIRDITERRRAEAAGILLAAIVESSGDAIVGKDLNGIVTSWNAGAEGIFGYSAAEMVGQSITRIIPPDRLDEEVETLARIRRGERIEHFETVRRRKDGGLIDISLTVSPIKDSTGQIVGASKVARDITDWKRTEDLLREGEERYRALNADLEDRVIERTAQLDAANKELEAFSYSVSHDLRAPLRAVDGFSQAVVEDYGPLLPEEGRRYLATIRDGAQRMGALIDDLLTFSRLSRAPLIKQAINVVHQVRGVLADLHAELEGRRIEISVGDLPECEGDPALLKQVWINLLLNAIKYTRKREAAVVEVGFDRGAYYVRDNGTGFDMRYAPKLFGVFQRLHRAEEYEGTGVGLAIVERVIHRHGGRVWAEAAPDRGATFHFTLEGNNNHE